MYEKFYGFRERPFEITPNPKFVYLSEIHQEALAYLQYAVREGKGFSVITGEAGTGKTTLVHMLLSRLDGNVRTSYIFNPILDRADFLNYVCDDLGIESGGMKSRGQSLTALHNFLLECFAKNEKVFLIIDEAQSMEHGLLQEVRLLTNPGRSPFPAAEAAHRRPLPPAQPQPQGNEGIHPPQAQAGRIAEHRHFRQRRHPGGLPLFQGHPAPDQHRMRQRTADGLFKGAEPDREKHHPGCRRRTGRPEKGQGKKNRLRPDFPPPPVPPDSSDLRAGIAFLAAVRAADRETGAIWSPDKNNTQDGENENAFFPNFKHDREMTENGQDV